MQGENEKAARPKANATADASIQGLRGINVLVTEDDLFFAMDITETLLEAGARVVGPVSSTERAIKLLDYDRVDAAVLDISLNQEVVFPLAERLAEREIPFLFASGCDPSIIPDKFADVPLCGKPTPSERIILMLFGLIAEARHRAPEAVRKPP